MSTQKHYPTDLTDRHWQRIAPMLPHPKQGEIGWSRPLCDWRSRVNGILYVNKTGCQWRMLPKDDRHGNTVLNYFNLNRWRKQESWARVMATLRAGGTATPRALIGPFGAGGAPIAKA